MQIAISVAVRIRAAHFNWLERSGTFQLGDLRVRRFGYVLGYGAMHLSGAGIFGPPKDRDAALAVLREVVVRSQR